MLLSSYSYYLSTFKEIDFQDTSRSVCTHFISFPKWICSIYFLFSALFLLSLQFGLFLFPIHSCLSSSSLFFFFITPSPFLSIPSFPLLLLSRGGVCVFFSFWSGGNDSSLGLNPKQPYGKRAQFAAILCVCVQKRAKIFRRLNSGACVKNSQDEWYQTKL